MTNKQIYREFCQTSEVLPVFFYDWWLDVVCGTDNWDVALYHDKEGIIRGVWPYYSKTVFGFQLSKHPPLTPFLGIHIDYPSYVKTANRRYSFEHKVIYSLVDQMPKFTYFRQNFIPEFNNWQPLYWKDYYQTSYYTHQIDLTQDKEVLYGNISSKRRWEIKKAKVKNKVIESDDVKKLFELSNGTFVRKNISTPYDFATLKKLDQELTKRDLRKIYFCTNEQEQILSGVYIVKDKNKAYYLLGGLDPKIPAAYPMSLLFWQMITRMKDQVDCFDFEGSMPSKIELVFREFGGIKKSFCVISKTSNRLVDIAYLFLKGRRLL